MFQGGAALDEQTAGTNGHDGVGYDVVFWVISFANVFDNQGLFSGRWYFKLFNFLLSLGSLAMACLGKYPS
jgi:hypothetical protein